MARSDLDGQVGEGYAPICNICEHYFRADRNLTCRAFPIRIPDLILEGHFDHSSPMENQGNDYTFKASDPKPLEEETKRTP